MANIKKIIKLWPFHNMEIGRIDYGFYSFVGGEWVKGWRFWGGYNTVPNLIKGEVYLGMPFNTIDMITETAKGVIAKSIRQD